MILLLQANTSALSSLSDLRLIAPELILTVCACITLVMEVILPYKKSKWTAYFALAGIGLAFISVYVLVLVDYGTVNPKPRAARWLLRHGAH